MAKIDELLGNAVTVAIAGHISPDGDCVGSCMGMYLYLKKNRPDIQADIYLEEVRDVFSYIACVEEVKDQVEGMALQKKQQEEFEAVATELANKYGVEKK